jgi:hypothetical protein
VAQELKLRTSVLPLGDHGLDTARGAKDSRRLWPRIPGAWRKLLKQQKVTAIGREVTAIGRAGGRTIRRDLEKVRLLLIGAGRNT